MGSQTEDWHAQDVSKLVLVPAHGDAGDAGLLPQRGLLHAVASPLLLSDADVTLASNPCRIQFCSKHLVVVGDARAAMFRRHVVQHRPGAPLL